MAQALHPINAHNKHVTRAITYLGNKRQQFGRLIARQHESAV